MNPSPNPNANPNPSPNPKQVRLAQLMTEAEEAQLEQVLPGVRHAELRTLCALFDDFDPTSRGKLGLAEFRLLLAHLASRRAAPPPSLTEAREP